MADLTRSDLDALLARWFVGGAADAERRDAIWARWEEVRRDRRAYAGFARQLDVDGASRSLPGLAWWEERWRRASSPALQASSRRAPVKGAC